MRPRAHLTLVLVPLLLATLNSCGGGSSSTPMSMPAQVIATIPVGMDPVGAAVDSANNRIYVANGGDGVNPGNVMVIDGATNSVTATLAAGRRPCGIALNPMNSKLYVTNSDDDTITMLDTLTNNTQTVSLAIGSSPCAVAVSTANNLVYVANYAGTVTVLDGTTNNPTTLPVAEAAVAIAVNSVTNKIYVSNSERSGDGTLTVIDGASNSTSAVPLSGLTPAVFDVAVNSVTDKIYVSGGGITAVVDGTTLAISTIHAGGSNGVVAVNANTNKVYVADNTPSANNVTVLDGSTLSTVGVVPTGRYPGFITLDEAMNQIYVLNRDSGTVTVIDGASNSTNSLAVDLSPITAVLNPSTHRVYVVNACGADSKCSTNGTLSVIEGPH